MNGHRSSAKSGKNLFLYQHFQMEGHDFTEATVQIIDYIDSNTVPDITKALQDLELFWINTLCTAYPLGLNDNIKSAGNISQSNIIDIYFKSKIMRYKRGHGTKTCSKMTKRKKKIFKDKNEIENTKKQLKDDFVLSKNVFYRKIKSLQHHQLKQVYKSCGETLGSSIMFLNLLSIIFHQSKPNLLKTLVIA